jgi:DNA-binding HxlR family transcriptional regulator
MKSYGQFCPMARTSEIFAERWTPIIVRNMLMGCHTFSEILEAAPGLARSLLSQRLATLERFKIVERGEHPSGRGHAYYLTEVGEDLWPVVEAMGTWGARWLDLERERADPHLVLWDMSKRIEEERLPDARVVIRFDLTDRKKRNRLWLVLEPAHREVCDKDPGFGEDLVLRTDAYSLVQWHMGHLPLRNALKNGIVELEGPPGLVRRFVSDWQGQSVFASVKPR